MDPRFEQFCQERKYLVNVSPRTIEWYRCALKWLGNSTPDEAALKDFVMRMRNAGLKPSSCNCHIRAVNAFLRWSGSPHKIPRLKEEQRILPTFSQADIQKMMTWRAKDFYEKRLQCLVLTLADTGARIGEAIELRWPDVDLDNLLIKLHGKGAKDRLVPFSFELRRHLFRFKALSKYDLVFSSRHGLRLGRRNILRDVKDLCTQLGIAVPVRTLHSFRHSFAIHYLRKGGSVFHLQKCLGHTSLEMVRRYCNMTTEDLQQIHEKVSLLSPH
jgi:integrase/recombinase XerD